MAATFYGSIKTAALAWTIGDIGVGIMAWLNIIAILLLRKPVLAALKDYSDQKKQSKNPVFKANELGYTNKEGRNKSIVF
ncbi:hypothetical protein E0F88_05090 [Dyadobacter psychrotolerans]|uniref:Sodium:alanine symporter family protein n=2 Tax=Dyadobacter psychrotolerans TaxID=2541721 RepID=A0A4R5DTI3_9BACT|nr:hypothetical protein E0F88_05090 [Dyadobacter psychrotolerans]